MKAFRFTLPSFVLLACAVSTFAQYTVSTLAGGVALPTPAPAATSAIGSPASIATDTAGNVYFASVNSVFKVDTSGTMTLVAGNGRGGYSGDGGPATGAQLLTPLAIVVDASGNILIGDSGNYRVRRVSASGTISTVVGNGLPGNAGDGGPATAAEIGPARGMAFDSSGNLFIGYGGLIRRVTTSGTISTFATLGQNNVVLGDVSALVFDAPGNLFIADRSFGEIREISASGVFSTIAAAPYPQRQSAVAVMIGGQKATIQYAGAAPGEVAGVMQINAVIPSGITTGNAVPVTVFLSSTASQGGLTIAVH